MSIRWGGRSPRRTEGAIASKNCFIFDIKKQKIPPTPLTANIFVRTLVSKKMLSTTPSFPK